MRRIRTVWLVVLGSLLSSSEAQPPTPGSSCRQYSPNKIDYADADVVVIENIDNGTACCAACAAHNAARPAGSPASTNCTIGVWHGPTKRTCALKATALKPFNSTTVAAYQPQPAPPPPPPLRFASIYTDHAVLQSSPASSMVWGFANVDADQAIVVTALGGAKPITVDATLSDLPPYTGYTDKYIWSAKLPPILAGNDAYVITVAAPGTSLNMTISDILFGDVWICGGQSNMEYSINGSNGEELKHPPVNNSVSETRFMAESQFQNIRMIRAGHQEGQDGHRMLELLPPHAGGGTAPTVNGWSEPCPVINGTKQCRVDFSSMCWFFGRNIFHILEGESRGRPIGLIESCWSGSPDEEWSSKDALEKCLKPEPGRPVVSGGMWEGMMGPLLNTTIKGAIWYQGEADSSHAGGQYDGYNCTLPAMISDWREKWHESTDGETDPLFPFGIVQLNSVGNASVYNDPSDPGDPYAPNFGFAGLRWAQSAGYGYTPNPVLPMVFTAVSYDTPDRPTRWLPDPFLDPGGFNVHSPFKQPTAARLARSGLALVYNVSVDTTGPLPDRVEVAGSVAILHIKNAGQGVAKLRSKLGFEVLNKGHWESVPAVSTTNSTVNIEMIPTGATKIRYNWYSNPCGESCYQCAVYVNVVPIGELSGMESFLPLPPFIMDLN